MKINAGSSGPRLRHPSARLTPVSWASRILRTRSATALSLAFASVSAIRGITYPDMSCRRLLSGHCRADRLADPRPEILELRNSDGLHPCVLNRLHRGLVRRCVLDR